jgi:phage shock protein A
VTFNLGNSLADDKLAYGDHTAYPALGFNPAPGTTGTVSTLAQNFLTVSGHLEQAYQALTKAGQSGGFWEGDAANAFHEDIGKLPDYLDKATRSMGDAGRALDGWANDLSSLQGTAAGYEQQAENATRQLNQAKANPDLALAGQEFSTPQALQDAQARLDAATAGVTSAEAELNTIREQAKRLFAQHQDLVTQVEDALNKAKKEAPHKPGMFSHIGSALSGMMHGIADLAGKTWNFVKQHANVIAKIGDVLSTVGTVLSVAAAATAAIPIVGEVVEGVSIGVNGEALAAHALAKAAGAKVSDTTLAMDALGMVPGGAMLKGGTGALKAVKVTKAATKAFQAADDGARLAKGAEAAGKTLEDLGTKQLGKWAHQAQAISEKASKVLPGLSEKIGVQAIQVGKKTVYEATNATGHVAGAVVGAVQKGAGQVIKWEVPTLINTAQNAVGSMGTAFGATNTGVPPAGNVFTSVLAGRSGS